MTWNKLRKGFRAKHLFFVGLRAEYFRCTRTLLLRIGTKQELSGEVVWLGLNAVDPKFSKDNLFAT